MMIQELKKKAVQGQTIAWCASIGIVVVVLLVNRVFEHPSLIIGPVTVLAMLSCYFVAKTQLQKLIDAIPDDDVE